MGRGSDKHSAHRASQSFLWQGLLILLPLVVLATAGIWSLRGQRQAVEQKARHEATRLADSWAYGLDNHVRSGLLRSHRPIPLVPDEEPFPFLFPLNPKPPTKLEADRQLEAAHGDPVALEQILTEHPNAKSAAGLPIRVLALYQLYQLAEENDRLAAAKKLLEAAVVTHPSVLTDIILEELSELYMDETWFLLEFLAKWTEHGHARNVLRKHIDDIRADPRPRWIHYKDSPLFRIEVLDHPLTQQQSIQAVGLYQLATIETSSRLEYLGGLSGESFYAGVQLFPYMDDDLRMGNEPSPSPFASATVGNASAYYFLTDPGKLYAQHERQVRWFIGVIAAAAITALIGLWVARRAFLKQQAVNRMKSNFVSSVSHELRAPIASIRLMAERLRAGKVEEKEKRNEYFGFIEQESRRLATLVENVLDFSRIEDGRKVYNFKKTDIEQLAVETVQLMEPHAAEKKVTLETEFRPPLLAPSIDPMEVQQALINLIDNAIKYSPEDKTITVGLANGNPGKFKLWVQDHGPGIPREEQQKIFQRFYRVGSELERETQGVGIGLAIVRHTAEAHGGSVTLDSSPQTGSRFTIELPIQQKQA